MVRYTPPGGVRCLLVLERSVESGVDRCQVVHAYSAARDAVAIRPSIRRQTAIKHKWFVIYAYKCL